MESAAPMEIALIVAVADNGVIGRAGALPWHLPTDLKRFRARTLGHHVVMGRRTWHSIGRPLPGRTNVVVSRDPTLVVPGATVVASLQAAIDLAAAADERELFVIGGGELYREALPRADRIYLTRVRAAPDGDAFFPTLDPAAWTEVAIERVAPAASADAPAFEIVVLERPRAPQPTTSTS
jgi:dihydrofolate reductase